MSNTPQPPSTACDQAQEAILALLDDEFIAEQQALLSEHLPGCKACQAYHESMEHLTISLRKIDTVPVPQGLEDRIMARIAAEQNTGSQVSPVAPLSPRSGNWLKAAPMAAAALLVALAIPVLVQTLHPAGQTPSKQIATVPRTQKVTNNSAVPKAGQSTSSNQDARQRAKTPNAKPQKPAQNRPSVTLIATGESAHQASVSASIMAAEPQSTRVNTPLDISEVASALPSSVNLESTYASANESDVYYDPVSNLVQF